MAIEFACGSCNKRYRVKEELAGKRARCKACGHVTKIPSPEPPPPDDLSGLSSFLDEELASETSSAPPPPSGDAQCPACGATIESSAVVCLACGFDQRTGEKLSTLKESEELAKAASERAQPKSQVGRFIRGTVLSAIGALIGAGIWAAVALGTGYEIGWIAWGVGLLAGGGMSLGYQGSEGTTSGIVAAVISLGAIFVAKIIIFVGVIAQLAIGLGMGDIETQRMILVGIIANEKIEAKGIDPLQASELAWADAEQQAQAQVDAMDDTKVEQRVQQFMDQAAAEAEHMLADEAEQGDVPGEPLVQDGEWVINDDEFAPAEELPGQGVALGGLFFAAMFGPIDALFILFAVMTAYKIGSAAKQD